MDPAYVAGVVARNIQIKRDVVVADEREHGSRKLLNLGHSIGHAVEAAEGYTLGHGNCVSIGLVAMCRAAVAEGALDARTARRIQRALEGHGLMTRTDLSVDEVFSAALHDKKRSGDAIDLVVPHGLGRCVVERRTLAQFRQLLTMGLGQDGAPAGAAGPAGGGA